MTATVIFISATAGAVASLLHAIRVGDRPLEVISKTAASGLFVALGFWRWTSGDPVGSWLLAGLALCAIGDLLLLGERRFDLGLAAFLAGHVCYVLGFRAALAFVFWPTWATAPLMIAGVAAASWLWPHLGTRRIPVSAYIVAISVMVWGGFSAAWDGALPWTVAAGALLFYLSDVAVARQRFIHPSFANRGLGLPLYYAGQVLIAVTITAG